MVEPTAEAGTRVVLRIAEGGLRLEAEGARLTLGTADGTSTQIDLPNPQAAALVAGLARPEGLDEAALAASRDAARIHLALERVRARAEVVWELWAGDQVLARVRAVAPGFQLALESSGETLDKAAHLRRSDAGETSFPVVFSSPGLSCEIGLSPAGAARAAALLAGAEDRGLAGFLTRCGVRGENAEDSLWGFHDRVMHDATRPRDDGRSIAVVSRGDAAGGPPEMEWMRAGATPVAAGDANDPLVRRRTLRDFAPTPPSATAVRALLRRCLRYQAVRGLGAARWVERASPAAGGLGEIIGYVAVRTSADGLSPGLYRHDPLRDSLDPVAGDQIALGHLFDGAAAAMLRPGRPPPMVLILASRIDPLAWKYGALGYRLALLNAGAAASVLQLAADDLGLGCCPLGTGAVRSMAALTGLDGPSVISGGHREVPLLEIALGVRPAAGGGS